MDNITIPVFDNFLICKRKISKKFEKGEKVYYSSKVLKYNRKSERDERIFVITNKRIYMMK